MRDLIEGICLMLISAFAFVMGLTCMILVMAAPFIALGAGAALGIKAVMWLLA